MRLKRYIANDMNEAMIKIKNELGSDAIIISTRKIKKPGFMGVFRKKIVEVTAAIDKETVNTKTEMLENQSNFKEIEKIMKIEENVEDSSKTEISELKVMVEKLIDKVSLIENSNVVSSEKEIPEVLEDIYYDEMIEYMVKLGIRVEIAEKILEIVSRQINISKENEETVFNAIKVVVREYLGDIKTIDSDLNDSQAVYIFAGPTGVGKTTTVAKIAARLTLMTNKSVGLITLDTYRIAAVEQLRTYGEILGIPLEVIYEEEDFNIAIEKFKDKDYILIDTAGRSHNSEYLKKDLTPIFNYFKDAKTFLVLSMTTSFNDMENIVKSYDFLDDFRLLFTKMDEASGFGNVLNMKVITGKYLSYFTIGQSVPDDIETVDKEKLLEMLLEK